MHHPDQPELSMKIDDTHLVFFGTDFTDYAALIR